MGPEDHVGQREHCGVKRRPAGSCCAIGPGEAFSFQQGLRQLAILYRVVRMGIRGKGDGKGETQGQGHREDQDKVDKQQVALCPNRQRCVFDSHPFRHRVCDAGQEPSCLRHKRSFTLILSCRRHGWKGSRPTFLLTNHRRQKKAWARSTSG